MAFRQAQHLIVAVAVSILAACSSTPKPNGPASEVVNPQPQRVEAGTERPSPSPVLDNTTPQTVWQEMRAGFVLPDLKSPLVTKYEKLFTRNPQKFSELFERAQWFLPDILDQIEERDFPTELALIPAVESGYRTNATSSSQAAGLWQFIRSTGRLYGMQQNWWYDGRRDPFQSTQAAMQFFGELSERFDGQWFYAIAGYNAGGTTIDRAIKRNRKAGKSTHYTALNLRRETRHYVPKLIAYRNIIQNPEKFGVTLPTMPNESRISLVDANSQIALDVLAKKLNIKYDLLAFLNQAHRQGMTPPDGPHDIVIPNERLAAAQTLVAKLPQRERLQWAKHVVQPKDVLGRIAKRYNVSVASIRASNRIKNDRNLRPGDVLLIPVSTGKYAANASPKSKSKSKRTVTHRVKSGDTLWDIARRYGVKVKQLAQWNKLSRNQTLKLGQKLVIYPS